MEPAITDPTGLRPTMRRLLWFVGLWAAGVVSVMSVAAVLRWVLLGRL